MTNKNETTESGRGRARARRMPRAWLALLALVLAAGGSLSCADGFGGDFADSGGISGTGLSQGPVTAFGSIFVNDVEWDLSGATIVLDGSPALEDDLRLGMVVRVEGRRSADGTRGNATRVVFDDEVEGPIDDDPLETVPGVRREFHVLGLPVVIELGVTSFADGASFAGLMKEDVVEVSGLVDGDGKIRATRVELKGAFDPGVSQAELEGTISNLDIGNGSFELGGIFVRYGPLNGLATVYEDLSEGDLQNGLRVEVKGVLRDVDELDALRIEREDDGLGDDSDDVELEGYVTRYVSLADLDVAGARVDASGAVLEPPGLDLSLGPRVEVHGRLVGGVLIADRIEDEEEEDGHDEVRIEAAVTSVNAAARTLVLLGVEVAADAGTRIEDKRDEQPQFRFGDIQVGDWLEVEGAADGADRMIADSIERDEEEDDVFLRGPVTDFDAAASPRELWIMDQPIPIHGGTVYEEGMLDELGFFGAVQLGDVVKATDKSAVDASALLEADEVEFED